jgi:hypothetical protein
LPLLLLLQMLQLLCFLLLSAVMTVGPNPYRSRNLYAGFSNSTQHT